MLNSSHPHQWQLFGDGEDITMSIGGGQSILMRRAWIESYTPHVYHNTIDVSQLGDLDPTYKPGLRSCSVDLTLRPESMEVIEDEGLWLPDKQIRQLSITELFGIINDKIGEREKP